MQWDKKSDDKYSDFDCTYFSILYNCVLIVTMFCARSDDILTYMLWKFHHPVYSNPSFICTTRVFSWECWEKGESDIGEGRLWRGKNAKYWKTLEGRKHLTRRTTNTTVYIRFNEAILRGNVILQIMVTVTAVLSVINSLYFLLGLGVLGLLSDVLRLIPILLAV